MNILRLILPILTLMAGGNLGAVPMRACVLKHAGKFWASAFGRLPELIIAAFVAQKNYELYDSTSRALGAFAFTYWAIELGYTTFYKMIGHDGPIDKAKSQWLEYFRRPARVNGKWVMVPSRFGLLPLYERLGGNLNSPLYSWFMMSAKGLLIGAFIPPAGLLLAILYPASYWAGHRVQNNNHALAEAFVGLALILVLNL